MRMHLWIALMLSLAGSAVAKNRPSPSSTTHSRPAVAPSSTSKPTAVHTSTPPPANRGASRISSPSPARVRYHPAPNNTCYETDETGRKRAVDPSKCR